MKAYWEDDRLESGLDTVVKPTVVKGQKEGAF